MEKQTQEQEYGRANSEYSEREKIQVKGGRR